MSSLFEKLGYLSDTEFAAAFFKKKEEVPADVDGLNGRSIQEVT